MPIRGPILTSLLNPNVKYARSLHARKSRYRERAFLVEGVRLFSDALGSGAIPSHVFIDQTRIELDLMRALEGLDAQGTHVYPVDEGVIQAIADTQTPQGIVAVFGFPDLSIPIDTANPLLVIADGMKDPGNLGTLMRAALGAGVQGIFLSPETVDPYSPKVVRSAMGAHFRLPIRSFGWGTLPELLVDSAQRLAADARAQTAYDQINWTQSTVLVVGSETDGISEEARLYAPERISIPLEGGLESLNAAVAGAVILFEAARQRRMQ